MGPSPVVVLDILLEDAAAVAVVEDQKPVQATEDEEVDQQAKEGIEEGQQHTRAE